MESGDHQTQHRVPIEIRAERNGGYICADVTTGEIWLERWVKDKRFGRGAGHVERTDLPMKATRIEYAECYVVHHDGDPKRCGWANPIRVGIPETLKRSDGTTEEPAIEEARRLLRLRYSR